MKDEERERIRRAAIIAAFERGDSAEEVAKAFFIQTNSARCYWYLIRRGKFHAKPSDPILD